MCEFISPNNSASTAVLNLLEPIKLIFRKVVIERITVVKFGISSENGSGAGCFDVKILGGYSEVHECCSSKI